MFLAIDPNINLFIIEGKIAHHLTTLRLGRAVVPHDIFVYVPIGQLNVIIIGYALSRRQFHHAPHKRDQIKVPCTDTQ